MDVASRELRNNTRSILERAAQGEDIVITVHGRPMAMLRSLGDRPRWMSRREFTQVLEGNQADPNLDDELAALAPDTTDDLSFP